MMFFQHSKPLKIYKSFKTCLKETNMQQKYCILFLALLCLLSLHYVLAHTNSAK